MFRCCGRKRAFTLIELLVVVAIISILAAILFPVFARARENARRASCMSNVKQMGLGMMMYVQDYDGTYPLRQTADAWSSPFGNYSFTPWQGILQPYTKSFQVFECPSSGSSNVLNGEYGVNYLVLTSTPIKESAVQSPASTYLIMDAGIYYSSPYYNALGTNWNYLPGQGDAGRSCSGVTSSGTVDRPQDCQSGRHFGGINIAFADGHVKWLKSSVVLQEGNKCMGSSSCSTHKSAWNPLLDNS